MSEQAIGLSYTVFEELMVGFGGIYHYYGNQPMWWFSLPLWWTPCNTIGDATVSGANIDIVTTIIPNQIATCQNQRDVSVARLSAGNYTVRLFTPDSNLPFAMAISSTLSGALLVETGQKHNASARFVTRM